MSCNIDSVDLATSDMLSIRIVLMELTRQFEASYTSLVMKHMNAALQVSGRRAEVANIDEREKEKLYHISGFLWRKLLALAKAPGASANVKKFTVGMIYASAEDVPASLASTYAQWSLAENHGGLIFVKEAVLRLTIATERHVRGFLCAESLVEHGERLPDAVEEAVLCSEAVSSAWGELLFGSNLNSLESQYLTHSSPPSHHQAKAQSVPRTSSSSTSPLSPRSFSELQACPASVRSLPLFPICC
jgi:hypothetical protein